ncbi:MAG: thymidine phosphorylase [Thermoleophilia bacterium]
MAAPLAPVEVIERSRRGELVDPESVDSFVRSWLDGTADDAQMAAWCMVGCLRGMAPEHVEALTRALLASGDRLELGALGPTGDLASTGGVGDTTTLVAAPLAAALGVRVAKMTGRGLAHTGGTLDKLEAIPGFRGELPLGRFLRQVTEVGIATIAQTSRLTPGDHRLYALRDATGTVPAAGLIAASVMSRRIAGGAGAIALDVKAGEGGFFPDQDEARAAAELMASLAEPWGRRVRWTVSSMAQPLGRCVGNALEVREAGEVLRGGGAPDLRELAVRLAAELAEACGVAPEGEGAGRAAEALTSGAALEAAERWVEAQDGDPDVWTDPGALPTAPVRDEVLADGAGWVGAIDARVVGEAARWLGAGRLHPDQSVDPVAGIELLAKVGAEVAGGQPLAVVHARDEWAAQRAREMVAGAVRIAAGPVEPPPLILAAGRGGAGAP